jgi:hypothetical protein
MPKYFDGECELPFERFNIEIDAVSRVSLERAFARTDSLSLCVRLPGLDTSCLGYIFNIKKSESCFSIFDVTKKLLLTRDSTEDLESLIRHSVGYAYDVQVHRVLAKLRNLDD